MPRSHGLWLLAILLAGTLAACDASQPPVAGRSVLFVGNSILFYEDVPQMLVALAASQGEAADVEMLAQAGFSLAEHTATGRLVPLIESGRFDYLVLQDVGGWPYCAADNERCAKTEKTLEELSRVALENGVVPIWLGTWHPLPEGQKKLSIAFEAMSDRVGIRSIDAGPVLLAVPDPPSPVFLPDYHPDEFGSWLLAGLVYQDIFSSGLKVTTSSVEVCRRNWRGASLSADSLASEQAPAEVTCGELSSSLLTSIVRSLDKPIEH